MSEILAKKNVYSARLITAAIIFSSSLLSTINTAYAENMYIYKDKNGQVLLTNSPNANYSNSQKVTVTYYPNTKSTPTKKTYGTRANTPPQAPSPMPSQSLNSTFDHYIRLSASRHGVDPALLKAMMHTESAFNPNARSHAGAQGLMQLMPATARRFKVINPWNPSENIEGAAKYVAWLHRRFNGNVTFVLAGYNAGEGNVDKYGGIPPFKETQNYVKKVLNRYNTLYRNDPGLFNITTSTTPPQTTNVVTSSYGFTSVYSQ